MIRCLCLLSLSLSACGAPCADDRCSLTPTQPQVTRTDYVNKPPPATTSTTTSSGGGSAVALPAGSGAPPPAGSGAPPPAVGSGSAPPPVVTPPPAAGSGAVAPPPQATSGASWAVLESDLTKGSVATKTAVAATTLVKVEFVKLPEKTPFLVTLQTIADGGAKNEAAWNDCTDGRIRCDTGTKAHTVRRAGRVAIQGGVNWSVTSVVDDGGKTLVTWTNNLSREVLTLRLTK